MTTYYSLTQLYDHLTIWKSKVIGVTTTKQFGYHEPFLKNTGTVIISKTTTTVVITQYLLKIIWGISIGLNVSMH